MLGAFLPPPSLQLIPAEEGRGAGTEGVTIPTPPVALQYGLVLVGRCWCLYWMYRYCAERGASRAVLAN